MRKWWLFFCSCVFACLFCFLTYETYIVDAAWGTIEVKIIIVYIYIVVAYIWSELL